MMKYHFYLFIICFSLLTQLTELRDSDRVISSRRITKNQLKTEIIARMDRVDELRAIKELAASLGIKNVYLFGGSAAAWAHYVYWDLEREAGMGNYHESRFDYDYTSIFRSNQDMDIVVDVSHENEELVSQFEKILQSKFKHFQGSKSAWEVRPLRFRYGDKDQILDNVDFLNQNSDSHSTGLISVTDHDELEIRDFKDWENEDNHFFNDVFDRSLHYYRDSGLHKRTDRYKKGLNPEIFSAVRYLIKAFQYELTMDEKSLLEIQNVFREFKPKRDFKNNYVEKWMENNGVKLYQNAVNLEFAYNIMKQLGVQEKLQWAQEKIKIEGTLAWWMNKMPLLSYPITKKRRAKTARDLGITEVAHETKSFEAYEAITKSHSGLANVFISRDTFVGEAAAYGDGFYTMRGKQGARYTGFTIHFNVHPEAVLGKDFIVNDKMVIFLNKAALEVIPETLDIAPVDYFKMIESKSITFDERERGVREKIRRRISLKMNSLSSEDSEKIKSIIIKMLENDSAERDVLSRLLTEWLNLSISVDSPEIIELALSKGYPELDRVLINERTTGPQWETLIKSENFKRLVDRGYVNHEIVRSILSQEYWAKNEVGIKLVKEMMLNGGVDKSVIKYILPHEYWANHDSSLELLHMLLDKNDLETDSLIVKHVLKKPYWSKHVDIVWKLVDKNDYSLDYDLFRYVLHQPHLKEEFEEYIEQHISNVKNRRMYGVIAENYLSKETWKDKAHWGDIIIDKTIKGSEIRDAFDYTLNYSALEDMILHVLSKPFWADHPEWIEKIVAKVKPGSYTYIEKNVLSLEHWKNHPYFKEKLKGRKLTVHNIEFYLFRDRLKRNFAKLTCSKKIMALFNR